MLDTTCCFTGHRNIQNNELVAIKKKLYIETEKLINSGVLYFGSGGARGFDLLAAEVIVDLRCKYPDIRLIFVLPCPDHTKYWSSDDKRKFEFLCCRSNKIKILSSFYYNGCMLARNRHLVDNARYVICYKRNNCGGTVYTFDYARTMNRVIIEV